MTLRRGGTPLMGGGGGGGGGGINNNVPTLEASNQAQIDDLVQRNRTLEHTNKKLSEQLSQEHSRSKDTILQLQSQWEINQSHWKQTCQNLLGSYRIIQKQVQVELEKERMNTLKEMKITRDEKLLRLQRDFKISLFQMKEEELERRVEDVEVEKTTLMETNDLVVQKLQEKCADYVIKLRDILTSLSRVEKEKEEKETKLNKLLEGRANLEASSESIKSKLERTKLQLDGAQTKTVDLERLNDELKRTNAELTRQLEKWQSLETKEGEAADTERKQRIALEMELREVTETFEKKLAKAATDAERANARVEKMKSTVKEWEGAFNDLRDEAGDYQKQLSKAHKQIESLNSALETERAGVRTLSPPQSVKVSTPLQRKDAPPEDDDPVEIEASPSPPPPRRARAKSSSVKPSSSKQPTETVVLESTKFQKHLHSRTARKSTGGKPPPKKSSTPPQDDSEIEEISDPNMKKGKAKATESDDEDQTRTATSRKNGKRKATESDEEDQTRAATSRKNGKRKATSDDDDNIQVVERPKRQKTKIGRAGSEIKETGRTRIKPSSRATSKQLIAKASEEKEDRDNGGGADVAQKNSKKRKINIFPTGNDAIQFSFGGNLNGLNIPTTLSPVKEDEIVPSRSMSSMRRR